MYITPNQYFAAYRDLKRTSLSHSTCKLVIFVSCLDVDSLCAAKMFSLLLKKELIQYQLLPVVGYKDLKLHYDRLDDDVSNVMLIGCGAMLDIESFLEVNPEELLDNDAEQQEDDQDLNDVKQNQFKRKIYVIDGHRPWNLDNLFGSEVVVCFDDGYVDGTLLEEKKAYEILILEGDEEDSGSESELDSAEEVEEETDVDLPSESELAISSQDSEDTISRKRKLQERHSRQLEKLKKQKRSLNEDKLQTYYNQGSTISTANTITVYALLTAIGETNLESLWIAIIEIGRAHV